MNTLQNALACTLGILVEVVAHVRWTKNCTIPVCHEQIIAFVQAVGTCLYSDISNRGHHLRDSAIEPAPRPFSPFSSSSSSRKFLGTLAMFVLSKIVIEQVV